VALGEEVVDRRAPADDGAAAVHGRRSGALAEDGGGPRGEGAGPHGRRRGARRGRPGTSRGRRGGQRGGDGRGRRQRSVGIFGSLTASFRFVPDLENFRERVSCIYRWNHHWRAT
jgi:hypothetical protein